MKFASNFKGAVREVAKPEITGISRMRHCRNYFNPEQAQYSENDQKNSSDRLNGIHLIIVNYGSVRPRNEIKTATIRLG